MPCSMCGSQKTILDVGPWLLSGMIQGLLWFSLHVAICPNGFQWFSFLKVLSLPPSTDRHMLLQLTVADSNCHHAYLTKHFCTHWATSSVHFIYIYLKCVRCPAGNVTCMDQSGLIPPMQILFCCSWRCSSSHKTRLQGPSRVASFLNSENPPKLLLFAFSATGFTLSSTVWKMWLLSIQNMGLTSMGMNVISLEPIKSNRSPEMEIQPVPA